MYYYIINPAAGDGSINAIQDKLKLALNDLGIGGEFVKTTGPEDAARLTQRALERKFKTIVAVGGDGTVDEILKTIHSEGKNKVAIGIIPIGHQNQLARILGISGWKQACHTLATRHLMQLRLLRANDEIFLRSFTLSNRPEGKDTRSSSLSFGYHLKSGKSFVVKGATTSISVTNQRCHDLSLPDKLLVRFDSKEKTAPDSEPWSSFKSLLRRGSAQTASQLHAERLTIIVDKPLPTVIDSKTIEAAKFTISLTEEHLTFITNRIPY